MELVGVAVELLGEEAAAGALILDVDGRFAEVVEAAALLLLLAVRCRKVSTEYCGCRGGRGEVAGGNCEEL